MSKIIYEVTVENSNTYWRLNGKLHRKNGPAVEWEDGTKHWYKNGERHREDGPACDHANGNKYWYINDLHHREDGPAIERTEGTYDWYLDGKHYTQIEFKIEIAKRKDSCDGKVVEIDGKKYKLSEYNE